MDNPVTVADFRAYGQTPAGLGSVQDSTIQGLLDQSWEIALSYVRKRKTPPFISVGNDVRDAVIQLTRWRLVVRRGFNPGNGQDVEIKTSAEEAVAWLMRVADGSVEPNVIDSTTSDEASPLASSEQRAGWAVFGFGNQERQT